MHNDSDAKADGESHDLSKDTAPDYSLREVEQHFAELVAGVEDHAIFLMNPNGIILSWNAARNGSRVTQRQKSSVSRLRVSIRRMLWSGAGRRRSFDAPPPRGGFKMKVGGCARTEARYGPTW